MEIKNRKARYNYFILKEIECGIVLTGTEIKSLRKGSADIKDCYAKIKNDEAFLINMYIAKYDEGNRFNHDERRTRKLLLHKTEIKRLKEETQKQGYTLIPLELYFKNNKAKIKLGIAKGKHNYDKRQALKEKQIKRDIERNK